jgi:transposase
MAIHLIADNYATHEHAKVKAWLAGHPRFHMRFTPTSSSWLNLAERFFRDVTEHIREGSFASTRELADSIMAFLSGRNQKTQGAISGRPRARISCVKSNAPAQHWQNRTRSLSCELIYESLH